MKRSLDLDSKNIDRLVEAVTSEVHARLQNLRAGSQNETHVVQSMLNEGAVRFSTKAGDPAPLHSQLAGMIDHTLLKPDASHEQIKALCEEASKYKFATVCVNSSNVGLAAKLLAGSGVKPIAVVGFPLGAASAAAKAFETLEAIRDGAQEIDTVINLGALKSKDYKEVFDDLRGVVEAAGNIPVKVILETSSLTEDEKVIGCALSKASGAAFVKTSTGFAGGGATVDDVKLMRRIVGPDIGVKASGGVRTYDDAKKMVEAGANRLGTSASVEIVTGNSPVKSDKGY